MTQICRILAFGEVGRTEIFIVERSAGLALMTGET